MSFKSIGFYRKTIIYEAETIALLARMTVPPSTLLAELINKTIIDLKAAAIWSELDAYYRYDLHTEQASLLNWKGNTCNGSNPGVSWAAKTGFTGNASSYLSTGFNPYTNGVKFTQNDNSWGVYLANEITPDATTRYLGGYFQGTTNRLSIVPRTITSNYRTDRNCAASANYYARAVSTTVGLIASRRLSTSTTQLRNGAVEGTKVYASTAPPNGIIQLLYCYGATGSNLNGGIVKDCFFGSSMTVGAGSKHELLYTINQYFINNVAATF